MPAINSHECVCRHHGRVRDRADAGSPAPLLKRDPYHIPRTLWTYRQQHLFRDAGFSQAISLAMPVRHIGQYVIILVYGMGVFARSSGGESFRNRGPLVYTSRWFMSPSGRYSGLLCCTFCRRRLPFSGMQLALLHFEPLHLCLVLLPEFLTPLLFNAAGNVVAPAWMAPFSTTIA